MFYRSKVWLSRRTRLGHRVAELWQRVDRRLFRRRTATGLIEAHAPGHSFADIGCMWAIDGEHSFLAEQAGATRIVGVDLHATERFEARRKERNSAVEFYAGEADDPAIVDKVGVVDVVWCFGVLYHHPSPYHLLVALRRMCGQKLLLETLTIPEHRGMPNLAVYFPMLSPKHRKLWVLDWNAPHQYGLTDDYRPELTYDNNFWGMSPSCIRALLATAGFEVEETVPSPSGPFRHLFVCRPAAPPTMPAAQ